MWMYSHLTTKVLEAVVVWITILFLFQEYWSRMLPWVCRLVQTQVFLWVLWSSFFLAVSNNRRSTSQLRSYDLWPGKILSSIVTTVDITVNSTVNIRDAYGYIIQKYTDDLLQSDIFSTGTFTILVVKSQHNVNDWHFNVSSKWLISAWMAFDFTNYSFQSPQIFYKGITIFCSWPTELTDRGLSADLSRVSLWVSCPVLADHIKVL